MRAGFTSVCLFVCYVKLRRGQACSQTDGQVLKGLLYMSCNENLIRPDVMLQSLCIGVVRRTGSELDSNVANTFSLKSYFPAAAEKRRTPTQTLISFSNHEHIHSMTDFEFVFLCVLLLHLKAVFG